MKGVRRKEVPALDDDLAKEVSDAETLDALRDRVRHDLQHGAEHEAEHRVRHELLTELATPAEARPRRAGRSRKSSGGSKSSSAG